jgi:glycogen synthase
MEIFHISAECYPVAKVGGLADVVVFYQSIKISQVILQELSLVMM